MATFEKHIVQSFGTGLGISTVSTTSGSYTEPSSPTIFLYNSSSYVGATLYFEAVFKVSAGTGYVVLWDNTSNSAVASSEVSTSSTSATRVRSGSFSLTDGHEYTMRFYCTGGNTNTYYSSRVVAVYNAFPVTVAETQISLSSAGSTTTSTTYADLSTIDFGFFRYISANWDGTVNIYLEATFKTSAGTASVAITDSLDGIVSSGEVTTTSSSFTRVRSSAITLSDGTDYKVRFKTSSGTVTLADARVIIVQTANPTKSESYLTLLRATTAASATGGVFQDSLHKIQYESANWSLDSVSWYHETNGHANTSSGTFETYNLSSAARTTASEVSSVNNSLMSRYRSSAVTMPTTQEITERSDSASGTIYASIAHLIAVMTWVNGSASASPSRSQSPSASLSPSASASKSASASTSASGSRSQSPSASLSPSASASKSASASQSPSPSNSISPSSSASPSASASPSPATYVSKYSVVGNTYISKYTDWPNIP